MKNLWILLLFLSNICSAQKQTNYPGFDLITHNSSIVSLQGKWRISQLITNAEITEYSLSQLGFDRFNYGNNITLNTNQTFVCDYSAECGNDCFTTTIGKYKIIDENYICFYLEKITRQGDCSGYSQPNKDLGLYYYYKLGDSFILLKSTGNIEKDKKNIEYRNLIINNYSEIRKFDNLSLVLFLNSSKQTNLQDEADIIAFCMAENQIKNYEILYLIKGDLYAPTFTALLKVNNEFRYVNYNERAKQVTLYDDSQIKRIEKTVKEIDGIKSLKKKSFKEPYDQETTSSDKNTITVYKNKNENYKIVYVQYNQNSETFYTKTIYFQNLKPIYIECKINTKSEMISYVLDWENSKVVNKIETETGYISTSIYREKPVINRIMELIKNQNL